MLHTEMIWIEIISAHPAVNWVTLFAVIISHRIVFVLIGFNNH